MENNYDKIKTLSKTSRKEGINNSPKTLNISHSETSVQEKTKKKNSTESKATNKQRIENNHVEEKTIGPQKHSAQDPPNITKNRPSDQ